MLLTRGPEDDKPPLAGMALKRQQVADLLARVRCCPRAVQAGTPCMTQCTARIYILGAPRIPSGHERPV